MTPSAKSSQASRTRRGWILLAISLPIVACCSYLFLQNWRSGGDDQATTITAAPGTAQPKPTHEQAMAKAVASIKPIAVPTGREKLTIPLLPTIAATPLTVPMASKSHSKAVNLAPIAMPTLAAASLSPMKIGTILSAAPPLEAERASSDPNNAPADRDNLAATPVRFDPNIECGTPLAATQISPTHYVVNLKTDGFCDWFMFRMNGVAGRTIRVDITGPDITFDHWRSLNPVYTAASDLDAPATYGSSESDPKEESVTAWNGAQLPPTDQQQWHYIANCWEPDAKTFSFIQHFDADQVYVALKVPYPPGYNARFFGALATNPLVKVVEVGRSAQNRPLSLAEIGAGDDETAKHKPCVLIYAGEHADEQDAMWTAQGAIEYLSGDTPEASGLRQRFTFLVIPMLDPDASQVGTHAGMICTFDIRTRTPESVAYANWFKAWVDAGERLDLVLDFHNVQSSESTCVACALLEGAGARGKLASGLHSEIVKDMRAASIGVGPRPWMRGWSPDRLGGWISMRFGALTLAYELNSQPADRHLSVQQLKQVGNVFARSVDQFFSSASGPTLIAEVDTRRMQRLADWTNHGGLRPDLSAIESEAYVAGAAHLSGDDTTDLLVEAQTP